MTPDSDPLLCDGCARAVDVATVEDCSTCWGQFCVGCLAVHTCDPAMAEAVALLTEGYIAHRLDQIEDATDWAEIQAMTDEEVDAELRREGIDPGECIERIKARLAERGIHID